MRTDTPKAIFLKDYAPAPFEITTARLDIDLDPTRTQVRATLAIRRRPGATGPLRLDGTGLTLKALRLDGQDLTGGAYETDERSLTVLASLPDAFTLETEVEIDPGANTSLEGLYMSNGMFCTQCEAEGFRKITYFLDRPDNLAVYTVRLTADAKTAPVLLSNGNPGASGPLDGGRHFAEWHDPHPKPSYLFALVAGDLGHIEDRFTTRSGRQVPLRIYTEHGKEERCTYAMDALKRSMTWDEEVFGREYDLDIFMIVAVSDFNAGAMENKGLNIFNDALVLASPETATDMDYERIESVIAHEYFHNWTGNRITCRDWFQLCLKEGLTVYRDQEFTADMRDPTVKRIDDVTRLRAFQFPEDAGGLAHSVRPDRFIKIDNFYTATVYEKGAELVRMLHTMLGDETFSKGMDIYFAEHDGEAATVEDFVGSFEKAAGRDLSAFMRWYAQAGTPQVTAKGEYDPAARTFTLHVTQTTPPTPGQEVKEPVPVPIRMGLLGADGAALPLKLQGDNNAEAPLDYVLVLTGASQSFVFEDIGERPTPSVLRHFSAPVTLDLDLSTEDSVRLIAADPDPFNRWEAAYRMGLTEIGDMAGGADPSDRGKALITALGDCLDTDSLQPAFLARLMTPPSEDDVAQSLEVIDPEAIHRARRLFVKTLASSLKDRLERRHTAYDRSAPFDPGADQAGRRALANTCLTLLSSLNDPHIDGLIREQARTATIMTDRLAGLSLVADQDGAERDAILDQFYASWQAEPLVVNKWFAIHARAARSDTLERVKALTRHEAFSLRNPNRVRALIGAFALGNPNAFHAADGAGYRFFAEQVLAIDKLNPLFAARLFGAIKTWRKLEPKRRALIAESFETIKATKGISDNLYEVVTRTLEG